MIYLRFGEPIASRMGYPALVCSSKEFEHLNILWKYHASSIFEIINGKTVYYKDRWNQWYRWGDGHQVTAEEEIVLRLKAVLL